MANARRAGQLGRQDKRAASLEIVPVDPLRDRFLMLEKQGLTSARQVAMRLDEAGHTGFKRTLTASMAKRYHKAAYDTTRVKRMLGIKTIPTRKHTPDGRLRAPSTSRYMRYEYAVTLADILGMAPVDAGV